jgi:putative membrane protein insertion efficiency factor
MARLLLALIGAYRYLLKPWWGNACRFTPTCSAYAMDAIGRHGAAAGSWLSLRRVCRCHPWNPGGYDPAP